MLWGAFVYSAGTVDDAQSTEDGCMHGLTDDFDQIRSICLAELCIPVAQFDAARRRLSSGRSLQLRKNISDRCFVYAVDYPRDKLISIHDAERVEWFLCGLTFELSRERRCGAWPARPKMSEAASRAKCHAGASRLERRVRPRSWSPVPHSARCRAFAQRRLGPSLRTSADTVVGY